MDLILDIVSLADSGFEMTVLHPVTDEPTDITITVVGHDSKRYKDFLNDAAQSRIDKLSRSMMKKKAMPKNTASVAEIEDGNLSLLAHCTLGWKNVVVNGETIPFSPEAAKKMYAETPWLREQVEEAISTRANFLKDSSKT